MDISATALFHVVFDTTGKHQREKGDSTSLVNGIDRLDNVKTPYIQNPMHALRATYGRLIDEKHTYDTLVSEQFKN